MSNITPTVASHAPQPPRSSKSIGIGLCLGLTAVPVLAQGIDCVYSNFARLEYYKSQDARKKLLDGMRDEWKAELENRKTALLLARRERQGRDWGADWGHNNDLAARERAYEQAAQKYDQEVTYPLYRKAVCTNVIFGVCQGIWALSFVKAIAFEINE